jgi:hypothetical protein
MNYLITVTVPYVTTLGPLVTSSGKSYLRLCDGITDITLSGSTYHANLLGDINQYEHKVNLFKGGNLEEVANFSFDMVDNNLLETLEIAGNSLNGGTCQYSRLLDDGTTVEPLWFGYVDTCEIKDNILSVNCVTVDYAMSNFKNPKAWGYNSKIPLEIDSSLSSQHLEFTLSNGALSEHPRLVQTYSTNNPTDVNKGVTRTHIASGNCSIVIAHCNDLFQNNGASSTNGTLVTPITGSPYYCNGQNLILKFLTGASGNTSSSYRIASITRILDGAEFKTKLNFKEAVFADIDIKAFDRVYIYQGISYYLLGPDLTQSTITGVSVKDSDEFYSINQGSYQIVTIGSKQYIAVYDNSNVYSEVPVNLDLSYHQWSTDGGYNSTTINPIKYTITGTDYYTSIDAALTLDSDMSSFIGIDNRTGYSNAGVDYTIYNDLYFKMVPDLSNYSGKTLYFGALIDRPSQDRDSIQYIINTYLDSGEVYPCKTDGTADLSSPFKSYAASLHSILAGFLNSAPMGDNSSPVNSVGTYTPTPNTVITNSTLSGGSAYFEAISNPTLFWSFDNTKLFQIPVNESVYKDIDYFMFTLRATCSNSSGGGAGVPIDNAMTFVYRVGIWAQVTIDSVDTIYLDTTGKTGSTGKPDTTAKDIITTMGDTVTGTFDSLLTSYTYPDSSTSNHYNAEAKSNTSKALEELSIENQIVIGQQEDGKWYTQLLSQSIPDASIPYSIPSNQIFDIKEPLKDIDITNVVNLPKFTFKDLDGSNQTLEVIDLDQTLPTLATFLANQTTINANFELSEDFISKAIAYSDLTTLYNLLLSPIWNICKASYVKNGITQSGNIDIKTTYLEYVLRTVTGSPTYQMVMDLGASGWVYDGTWNNFAVPYGWFEHTSGTTPLYNLLPLTTGQQYRLLYDVDFDSGGTVSISVNGNTISGIGNISHGSYDFTQGAISGGIYVWPTTGFNGRIAIRLQQLLPSQVPTNLPTNITNLMTMLSQRRKTLTLSVPMIYKNTQLGGRIKIFDPRLMANHTLYGFVTGTSVDTNVSRVNLSILCDSYADGSGGIDFF